MTELAETAPPELEHAAALRRTSDTFVERLDRLHELETRKRDLPPGEEEFVRIAREVEDLARELLYSGSQQVELAEEVHHEALHSDAEIDASIRETPPRRDTVTILNEWRAAERRLQAAPPDSDEERAARAESEQLREEFRLATSEAAPTDRDA